MIFSRPRPQFDNVRNVRSGHAELLAQSGVAETLCSQLSDLTNLGFGQLGATMVLVGCCTPLSRTVSAVISQCSKKQMFRIIAESIVTSMAHGPICRELTICQKVRDAMSQYLAKAYRLDETITATSTTSPVPALVYGSSLNSALNHPLQDFSRNVCEWFTLYFGHVGLLDRSMCLEPKHVHACPALLF